jgi:hypothetical protein
MADEDSQFTALKKEVRVLQQEMIEMKLYLFGDSHGREGLVQRSDRMETRYQRLIAWVSAGGTLIALFVGAVAFFGGQAVVRFLEFAASFKDVLP